jgi:cell fate (sporulation/competence/biofilm development) regulator YlbF (YheA/YmcA/DUF963 family)
MVSCRDMIKQFLMKQALRLKGVSKEEADAIAKKIDENPELLEAIKKIEENKEAKELFENIQKEMEEKTKAGMDQTMAMMGVMMKHKAAIVKHRALLEPLMGLMQK